MDELSHASGLACTSARAAQCSTYAACVHSLTSPSLFEPASVRAVGIASQLPGPTLRISEACCVSAGVARPIHARTEPEREGAGTTFCDPRA
jgi:hypothetical protein